jgi:hypothetical protein
VLRIFNKIAVQVCHHPFISKISRMLPNSSFRVAHLFTIDAKPGEIPCLDYGQ